MAFNSSVLKRFLTQKSVLDTLRRQMDLTGGLLSEMKASGILTEDELNSVQSLKYPLNRNELLQVLIRKQWTEESFKQFCSVLSKSQGDGLSGTLQEKVEVFTKATDHERISTERETMKETVSEVEIEKIKKVKAVYNGGDLSGLDMKQQNVIRLKLKERDDLIRELKDENHRLSSDLDQLTAEHIELKTRHMALDKAVQEMIARLSTTFGDEEVEAVRSITETFLEDRDSLIKVKAEKERLKESLDLVQHRYDVTSQEHSELQKKYSALKTLSDSERKQSTETIDKLNKDLTSALTKRNQLQRQVDGLQGLFGDNIRCLEHDLAKATRELREKTLGYDDAVRERNNARKEIKEVKERIRKLLFTLGLTNDIGKIGMSLEHARNISYAIRRNPNPVKQRKTVDTELNLQTDQLNMLSEILDSSKALSGDTRAPTPEPGEGQVKDTSTNVEGVSSQSQRGREPPQQQHQLGKADVDLAKCGLGLSPQTDPAPSISRVNSSRSTLSGRGKIRSEPSASFQDRNRTKSISVTIQALNSGKKSSSTATTDGNSCPLVDVSGEQATSRKDGAPPRHRLSTSGLSTVAPSSDIPTQARCLNCGKTFVVESNFEGSCLHHAPDAKKMHDGTALEVWSCCRSQDTLKGCRKARHQAADWPT